MSEKETGIPCFECGQRSGMDCPGRRSDEATRCPACMDEFMKMMEIADKIADKDRDILKRLTDSQACKKEFEL